MMSLTFGLFIQVSVSGPLGSLVHYSVCVWSGGGGRCVAGQGVQGM